MRQRDKKSLII